MRPLNKKTMRLALVTVIFVLGINVSFAQQVSPLQTGHYLPGFSNIRDMAQPPPGLFVLWYNYYATSNSYYDRNGDKRSSIPLSEFDPNLPDLNIDIDLTGFASCPAIFWAANKKILGGARFMAGVVPIYMSADASIITEARGGVIDTVFTNQVSGKLSGFTDIYISPVTLAWGWESFDFTFAYGMTPPTGRYETGADDNLGLGFWTNQFQGFGYYYPVPDKSTALMMGITYEINGKIKDEDFKPGNRLSLEYGISQYLSERLEVGIQGGHNWQVSDDTGEDIFWDPSIHDKKSTLNFTGGYWVWKEKMQLNFKYGFDYGMVQRFKNHAFMLNLTFVTNALAGKQNTPQE